jgi:putative aldouronate transport system permease protein
MEVSMAKRFKHFNSVSNTAYFIINIFMILGVIICIAPIFLIVAVSLTESSTFIKNGYVFLPQKLSLEAYRFLFKDMSLIGNAYMVTFTVLITGTILNIFLVTLYAYPLSRKDLPMRKFFTIFILITMLFGGGLAPFYMVYVRVLNLRNSIWALILPALTNGFNIFVVKTYIQGNIPNEIIESCKIDGAGEFRIFWQIVLPLSVPVVATIAMFSAFGYWNDWFNSMLFIDKPKLHTLQYVMMRTLLQLQFLKQQIQAASSIRDKVLLDIPDQTINFAMVVISIGPIIFAYPFFQKYFVKGLIVGSVKG